MLGAKRKYYQLENTPSDPITKIKKLSSSEYEEIQLTMKQTTIDNLTGSINDLSLKKRKKANADNPELVEYDKKVRVKQTPAFSYINLNTEVRTSFKKAFEDISAKKTVSEKHSKKKVLLSF
jgi:hypothetical protein